MTMCKCGAECPEPGLYYVSVKDDVAPARGQQVRVLAGPFPSHGEALDMVPRARTMAEDLDPKGVWYSYGTVRISTKGRPPIGLLNQQLGLLHMAKTSFREDELVEALTDNVTVHAGDKGRIMETGDWEYHRVYWPKYRLVAYHLGTQLRRLGS